MSLFVSTKSQKKAQNEFVQELENIFVKVNGKCLMVGDFNLKLLEHSEQNHLKSLIGQTNNVSQDQQLRAHNWIMFTPVISP